MGSASPHDSRNAEHLRGHGAVQRHAHCERHRVSHDDVEPKAYRFRLLNAANDRFFNLQWYVADSSGTEVALKASEVAAAQVDPNVFPTPDTTISPAGPNWLQIGSEAGFLPTPVTVPNQPITWITDPTRFDFGNVDQHSMLIAPAERSDVIVDFSKYAGKT